MSGERWVVDVQATAPEMYEAMVAAGQASLRLQDQLLVMLQSAFTCFLAPVGATILLWVIVGMAGGPDFGDLPAWAIPVTFFLFGGLASWLQRQSYFMMAQMALRSRFGRGYTATIDSEGITLTTTHSRWNSGWGDVAAVRGGKLSIAICISAIALPLPRRSFLGPQNADVALTAMQRWQEAAQ